MKTKRFADPCGLVPLSLLALALVASQARSFAQEVIWMRDTAVWKYYQVGDEPAVRGGKNWKQVGYDDSSWGSGPGQLGFQEGDEATLLEKGQIAYYFRHTLTVTQRQLDDANQLVVDLIRDDGAVVYINGVEIRRDNMAPGLVTSETTTNATVAGADEDVYFRTTHLSSAFTPGLNTVAVEIHQANAGSSDISFQMKMSGFRIIPVFGEHVPPAGIQFEEAQDGAVDFEPFPDELDLGWWSNANIPNSQVKLVHPLNGLPGPQGFTFGYCMAVSNHSLTLKTDVSGTDHFQADTPGAYRVNVSNYKDVKVQYDLRAWPENETLGMGSNDKAKFWLFSSVDGTEPAGGGELLMDLSVPPGSGPSQQVIVAETATKRVKVPTASLGDAWHLVGYNDASWTQGIKGTGYERSSSNTYDPYFGPGLDLEAQLYNTNGSVFMRVPFTVNNPSAFLGLLLCMRYDDGYVAYINGHEVARRNAPGSTGTSPAWNAIATGTHDDASAVVYEAVDIGEHLDKLVVGANMLAIHGLNSPTTSSDMLIEPELKAVVGGGGGGGGGGTGVPETLNDIARGIDGPFTTFQYDVPDSVNTVWMEWRLEARTGQNALFLDNILVTGTPLFPDSYRNWIFLTTNYEIDDLGAPDADPDGDLVKNALEYALGGNASVPDSDLLPTFEIVEVSGRRHLAMTWRQLNKTRVGTLVGGADPPLRFGSFKVQDITYIPQFSYDGENWLDGAPGPTTAIQIGDIEGEGETVQVSAYFIEPITSSTKRLFGRVKVEFDGFF